MFKFAFICMDLVLAINLALYSAGIYNCGLDSVSNYINNTASSYKMAAFPFKVGDYNSDVMINYPGEKGRHMSLPYDNDTIAFLFIFHEDDISHYQIWIQMQSLFADIKEHFNNDTCFRNETTHLINVDAMTPSASLGDVLVPVIHPQTAAHTSGAAFYYQRHHVTEEPIEWANKDIFGVSANAAFGDKIMYSGVMVIEDLKDSSFISPQPADIAPLNEEKVALLNKYI